MGFNNATRKHTPDELAEETIVRTIADFLMEPTVANDLHVRHAMTRYQTVFIIERARLAREAES